tara:strand:- start:1427 stop:1651 length:225 start_codon:yes stop_codon:yes gene_type:complete
MAEYRISKIAIEDLIRIHQYGSAQFGMEQADRYYEWFAANIDEGVNNHWVWFHVLEHSANHMGQIALVKNRLPK